MKRNVKSTRRIAAWLSAFRTAAERQHLSQSLQDQVLESMSVDNDDAITVLLLVLCPLLESLHITTIEHTTKSLVHALVEETLSGRQLDTALEILSSLSTLSLWRTRTRSTDDFSGSFAHWPSFWSLPSLRSLSTQQNITNIPAASGHSACGITDLSFRECLLEHEAFDSFMRSRNWPSLQQITIRMGSWEPFDDELSMRKLIRTLVDRCPAITRLELDTESAMPITWTQTIDSLKPFGKPAALVSSI